MTEVLQALHRRLRPLALAAGMAACAFAGRASDVGERIDWDHSALALYLSGVSDAGDRARIELCVGTHSRIRSGSTAVGFPRYRIAWGRWVDAVTTGIGTDHVLQAAAGEPACFSVLVAREATALTLPIGGQRLLLEIGPWLDRIDAGTRRGVEVEDPWGRAGVPQEPDPAPLAGIEVRSPDIVLTDDLDVEGAALPIARDRIVTVRLRARNVGEGTAHAVVAWIEPSSGVFPAQDGAERIELGDLAPGAAAEFVYRCYADRRAVALSFQVGFDHASDVAGGTATVVNLPLADTEPAPVLPPPISDIDRSIPHSSLPRPTGLAVVLGVEVYADAPPATHAAADARTAARYFEQVLGIPSERIEVLLDDAVSLGQLQRLFGEGGWLARRTRPDSEIFVFFAGHGMAELERFTPYLLPADADPDYVRQTALPVDRLIEMLVALDAKRTTVFLDACFGGLSREGAALLDGARPLVLVPVQPTLAGVSVFSAGTGTQIASSLDEQGHGLFTYHLFKGLGGEADQDLDRRISAGELKHYLEDAVPRAAQLLDREQLPAIALDDPAQVLAHLP